MQQARYLIGKNYFSFVDFGTCKRTKPLALLNRQLGVKFQEPPHIRIGRVAPELPKFVRRHHLGIKPDCAALGFAHLLAI